MRHPGERSHHKVIPSSSVFFWRPNNGQTEVFLARRRKTMRAFPGLWSGVGGKVTTADRSFLQESCSGGVGEELQVLKAAAVREVYEETGVLLARKALVHPIANPREVELTDLGLVCKDYLWDWLVPAGQRVTPKFGPLIFDTQFFLSKVPPGQSPMVGEDHPEFDAGKWLPAQEWVDAFDKQVHQIVPPVLDVVRAVASTPTVLSAAQTLESTNHLPPGLQCSVEAHPGIQVLPLDSSTLPPASTTNTVVIGRGKILVVDPGSPDQGEQELLTQVVRGMVGRGGTVVGVVLTHGHKDHWEGLEAFQKEWQVPTYVHPHFHPRLTGPLPDIEPLVDGQRFDLGWDDRSGKEWVVQVVETGGHVTGHVCLIDMRFNALVAGDFVSGAGTVLVEDMGAYLSGLRRLLSLGVGVVIPGHGPVRHDGHELLTNYLNHRIARLDQIFDVIASASGGTTVAEITDKVYSDVAESYRSLAKQQVLTNLRYLTQAGEVRQEGSIYFLPSS